ncbi:hypothetical protein GCM10022419_105980 [Nonomuraea rosea]|uniref:Integrase catalytic domain-containing protein n=1 Tax=Nonomuraea rosea TaxID=638574 RepID=A0ABP6ZE33_9ACTN
MSRRPGAAKPSGAHRTTVWEGDHFPAPVVVDLQGKACSPWITWFVDRTHAGICGWAVTPGFPGQSGVLTALRHAMLSDEQHTSVGGTPQRICVDRGKDFLYETMRTVLDPYEVSVEFLPLYHPHDKMIIEAVNGAAQQMFFPTLPCYGYARCGSAGQRVSVALAEVGAPPLTFTDFVALLHEWVTWWNTEHTSGA